MSLSQITKFIYIDDRFTKKIICVYNSEDVRILWYFDSDIWVAKIYYGNISPDFTNQVS